MARILLGSVLALAAASAVQARGAPADAAAVRQVEQDWLAHIDQRATLERILADDFRHAVPPGRFLDKSEHIAWAAAHPRPVGEHRRFAQLDVRVLGDAAVASGIVATVEADGGPERRSLFTDVFARRQGAWRVVAAQETPLAPPQ